MDALAAGIRQRLLEDPGLVGAQYVAATAEGTVVDLCVGRCDVAAERPMTADTWQMAYSMTKALTAIAVLQLVDRGLLSLDQALSDHFSTHPYGRTVTIGALLAHTAGIADPWPLRWFTPDGAPVDRDARLAALLHERPRLASAPGTRYRYSNLGYWLLEKVIERASRGDYAAYIADRIFGVLGGPHPAGFELPPRDVLAVGHARRFHPLGLLLRAMTPSRYWDAPCGPWRRAARLLPYGRGYGGLFCAARALAKVVADLLRPRPLLLSSEARDVMFSPLRLVAGGARGGTLGWVVGELDGVSYRGKQGGGLGFFGNLRVYPSRGLATVLLGNVTEISAGPIDRRSDAIDRVLLRSDLGRGEVARH